MSAPLLEIRNLRTYFHTEAGRGKAVDGVSLEIRAGEVLGLVGESGSGKSVTALSVLRLIPEPPGKIVGGEIVFKGRDLLKLDYEGIRAVRGKDIGMIFQEPMTSLNPVFTDRHAAHGGLSRARADLPARGLRPQRRDAAPGRDRRPGDRGCGSTRTSSPAGSGSAS